MIGQTLEDYIYKKYNNNKFWFEEEVKEQRTRISKIFDYRNYLDNIHKILNKQDFVYKDKEFKTKKLVFDEIKTILDFATIYLLGNNPSFTGTEDKVKIYNSLYRKGNYSLLDYKILDKVRKFGTLGEYIYPTHKGLTNKIKNVESRIIQPEDFYPIYTDTFNYVCAIEHWTHKDSKVDYYRIYYKDKVEEWDNDGGLGLTLKQKYKSYGLPVLWKNFNDRDERFGKSVLDSLIPLIDALENIISRLGDSIETIITNPILHIDGELMNGGKGKESGQYSMNVDQIGYCIMTESGGKISYPYAQMDYQCIKLYIDNIKEELYKIGAIPAVMYGQSNVANVSETSIEQLYHVATTQAKKNEKWFKQGLQQRWDIIDIILESYGIEFGIDEYIDIQFNYCRPSNDTETIDNILKSRSIGMMSIKDCIEKNPLISDVQQTLERLKEENEEGLNISKNNENESRVNDNENMNNKSGNSESEDVV
ncbi:phage portal protein [Clostridium botulinum D/C]|uniref:phage portal protein n=1 Tax=Clostridium botulinum TaxID=1491 RepID=UPI001E4EB063|nr:phage portal protein [Clostridium botulinum]MCD3240820.1 phage portal protein [Clostridium botulinum D/C]